MDKQFAMIIADNRETIALFRFVLNLAGFATEVVMCREKAVEQLDLSTPDVILLDFNLTGVLSSNILEKIHHDPHLRDVPVIVVTGYADPANEFLSAGDIILFKPVSITELNDLLISLFPSKTIPFSESPYDELTWLFNRSFFISQLSFSIDRNHRVGKGDFGVLFLDFDGFKDIEIQNGKFIADQIILETAKYLRMVTRPYDTIARFDFDHFFIQLEGLPSSALLTKIAERIGRQLTSYIREVCNVNVNVSIGVVYCNQDYMLAEDIIRDADIALHIAKKNANNNLVVFNPIKYGGYRNPERYAEILRAGMLPEDLLRGWSGNLSISNLEHAFSIPQSYR